MIDKAMDWKEKTMKAKWLWASWTYLMVVGIIVLEILFCFFSFFGVSANSNGDVSPLFHTDNFNMRF